MKARDIMTTPAITIRPETRVPEIAALLLQRRISGVPVVEHGIVVGVVSEADLLRRHEIGTERKHSRGSWWMRLLAGDTGAAEYVKWHAGRAVDIMTHPPVCIADDLAAASIAEIFDKRGIKRLPVLRDGRLVGIVTRADLVRVLADRAKAAKGVRTQSDQAIRRRLVTELSSQPWWRDATNVTVAHGVVHYWGVYENEQDRIAARIAAENVPGVKRIDDHRVSASQIGSMG